MCQPYTRAARTVNTVGSFTNVISHQLYDNAPLTRHAVQQDSSLRLPHGSCLFNLRRMSFDSGRPISELQHDDLPRTCGAT